MSAEYTPVLLNMEWLACCRHGPESDLYVVWGVEHHCLRYPEFNNDLGFKDGIQEAGYSSPYSSDRSRRCQGLQGCLRPGLE